MTWMILTPREADSVRLRRVPSDDVRPAADMLRKIQGALDARNELELSDDDLATIERSSKDWRTGYRDAFTAVLQAAGRH